MFGRDSRFDYFKAFSRQAEYACKEADLLVELLDDFNRDGLRDRMQQAHDVEHEADNVTHEIFTHLAQEFVAPIEREDISELAFALDDIIDYIEDVTQQLYMFNIQRIPDEAKQLAGVIQSACQALRDSLVRFPSFKRSAATLEYLVSVNDFEEQGDIIYVKAIHDLFQSRDDPFANIAWSNVYAKLEKCCDACEHVADAMQTVIMKNS